MHLKPNERVTKVKDRIANVITTKQVSGCGVKHLSGLYTSWAQDACDSTRLAGLSLLSTPLKTPPHQNLVYLRNVAKRYPHAARTWQVPRYPLGLPYRELLQGASFVAPRARHLSLWAVRALLHAQGRWFTPSMARDRFSHRPTEKGPVFYRSAGACPPRSLECANNGEGQALALRKRGPFFIVRAPITERISNPPA